MSEGIYTDHYLDERPWAEFQAAGLVWWTNRVLHLFGWAIVLDVESDGSISRVFPARTRFRGFSHDKEEEGFRKLSDYLANNALALKAEADA